MCKSAMAFRSRSNSSRQNGHSAVFVQRKLTACRQDVPSAVRVIFGQGEVDYYSTLMKKKKKQQDEEGRLAMILEHPVRIWVVCEDFLEPGFLGIIVPDGKNKKRTHNENCPRLRI